MKTLWTKIRHATLGKMWGGPVEFETKVTGRFYPEHISKIDQEAIVRVIHNFVELKINLESFQFHNPSTARSIARALMQAADVLDDMQAKARTS